MPSPEMTATLAALRAKPASFPDDVIEARAAIEELMGATPLAVGTTTEWTTIAGRPSLWVRPEMGDASRAVLYLHGGGYRVGSPRAYQGFVSTMAAAVGAPFLVPDYRLAPEHPFPAALDDAVAAYRTLLDHGYAAGQLAIAGDSAGGGLAAAALLGIRFGRLPQPAAAVCLSPWADLTVTAGAYERNAATDPFFNARLAREAAADYLGGEQPGNPLASPVFGDFGGLAPVLIHAADCEVLADDAIALAAAVNEGGEVRAELWPDMLHVWHSMTPLVPEAREAVAKVADWLKSHWA